jgi:hypothetical protein
MGPFADDVTTGRWWSEAGDFPVGLGDGASDAYGNLLFRLELIAPDETFAWSLPLSDSMWTPHLRWPDGQTRTVNRRWRGDGMGPRDA